MRFAETLCLLCAGLILSACGGGGGGGSSGTTTTTTTPVVVVVPPAANVVPLVVDSGPGNTGRVANLPYATVTVCPSGSTANCQTVDHVLVDTGSTGLRLLASALQNPSAFAMQTAPEGTPYAECAGFISGYTWGSVRTVDLTLGGLTARSLPIQVIADPAFPNVPTACSNTGSSQNSVAELNANGILGISHFVQDCGSLCVTNAAAPHYYTCSPSAGCVPAAVPLAQQVTHPVAAMSTDNNGSMLKFPEVSPGGQATVAGALVMGIGTRDNNAAGSAVAYGVSRTTGLLSTSYNGRTYSRTAFDSGSNFYFFSDPSLPNCTGLAGGSSFYCPPNTLTLSATVTGTNAASGTVSFRIANARTLFSTSVSTAVLPDVGGTLGSPTGFLWGMPFFYGRSVFTAIVDRPTPLGTGPFVAF